MRCMKKFQYPHSRIRLWLEEAPFKDVEKALLYAWMAECDPGQVLNMRKKRAMGADTASSASHTGPVPDPVA